MSNCKFLNLKLDIFGHGKWYPLPNHSVCILLFIILLILDIKSGLGIRLALTVITCASVHLALLNNVYINNFIY